MRGPRHGNGRPHLAGKSNRDPLRKIVREWVNEYGAEVETLECGHTIHRRSDMIGPTNAAKRRCRHCRPKAEV